MRHVDGGREAQSPGDETLDRSDMAAKWRAMIGAAGNAAEGGMRGD